MFQRAATAFITLFVSIGPFDVAAMFFVLTASLGERARRNMAIRACLIALGVLLVFTFAGERILEALQVGLPAFQTAGGILLLGVARDLVFAEHSGLSSTTPEEEREATSRADLAVFPLAIPLTAGPGSIAAVILLAGNLHTGVDLAVLLGSIFSVLLITLISMLAAGRLVKFLGETGINVISRLAGILLAAVAMQFIFNGLKTSGVFR